MKFTVQKAELMNIMVPAMGTVSTKNTITSIEGVLIDTLDNGNIQITTYDMTKGVRAICEPTSVERYGKYIINAQRLFQILKVLPNDEITFEIKDNLNCEIYSGKASFSTFCSRGEDFPNLPELMTERGFSINASILRSVVSKVMHSIAVSDARPMLCGAYFRIKGNDMTVVSCDGYTLSKCELVCDMKALTRNEVDYTFILPGHALIELMKIVPEKDEDISIYLTRKHVIFRCENITFFTRIIESEYIEYNRILPKDNDIEVVVSRDEFLMALERANIIADEKIQGSGKSYVKLIAEEDIFTVSSTSQNGKVINELECSHEGGPIEIAFNCRYLINSVRVIDSERVKIRMKAANQAITIEPDDCDESFRSIHMVLPMRTNNPQQRGGEA